VRVAQGCAQAMPFLPGVTPRLPPEQVCKRKYGLQRPQRPPFALQGSAVYVQRTRLTMRR
jgi:hypothetical protein